MGAKGDGLERAESFPESIIGFRGGIGLGSLEIGGRGCRTFNWEWGLASVW